MASIYKRGDSKYWWASFKNSRGLPELKSTKTADKDKAQKQADDWEAAAADIREHRVDPRIEKIRRAQAKPLFSEDPKIPNHLEDYLNALVGKGDTQKHVDETSRFIRRVLNALQVQSSAEIDAEEVKTKIISFKMPKDRKKPLSARRRNAYLTACRGFTRWLRSTSRAHFDPLEALHGFAWNIEADRRLRRRDILPDEMARILTTAEASTRGRRFSGKMRAMVYRVCWATGLRANEVRTLEREAFDLAATPPTITVEALNSKHRRQDILPISQELAELLKPTVADKTPKTRVFGTMNRRTAKMLHADMRDARAAWIKEGKTPEEQATRNQSDFLDPKNRRGEIADFHGLRHSFITQVVSSGVDPAVAMKLARHGSPELTLKRYAHVDLQKAAKSIPKLPKNDTPETSLKLVA